MGGICPCCCKERIEVPPTNQESGNSNRLVGNPEEENQKLLNPNGNKKPPVITVTTASVVEAWEPATPKSTSTRLS